jgi:hypothetical protein
MELGVDDWLVVLELLKVLGLLTMLLDRDSC